MRTKKPMSQYAALKKMRDHVAARGGVRLRISSKESRCRGWEDPKWKARRNCTCFEHPKDCTTDVRMCSVYYLHTTAGIVFQEVIAECGTWEKSLAKVLERGYWV